MSNSRLFWRSTKPKSSLFGRRRASSSTPQNPPKTTSETGSIALEMNDRRSKSAQKKISRVRKRMKNHRRFILVGLDNAGKTTLLNQLLLMNRSTKSRRRDRETLNKSPSATLPTLDFEMQKILYQKFTIYFTDVGGQGALRQFWRHHFTGIQGVLFVIDSSDPDRLMNAAKELESVLMDDQLKRVPFLIFANKQDVSGVLSVDEIEQRFSKFLDPVIKASGCNIRFLQGSGLRNDGIFEGLDWLCEQSKPM